MRWCWLSASFSVLLSSGCTAPNPVFDREARADSGDASKGSGVSEGSTDSDSTGSNGDGHDSKGEAGHDDDGHADGGHDDGRHDDDDSSDDGDDDDAQGCRVKDCDDDEYCAFPEGAFCAIEIDVRGTCTPRPDACQTIGPQVFGCDCSVYESACEARLAGVDVLCRVDQDFCPC